MAQIKLKKQLTLSLDGLEYLLAPPVDDVARPLSPSEGGFWERWWNLSLLKDQTLQPLPAFDSSSPLPQLFTAYPTDGDVSISRDDLERFYEERLRSDDTFRPSFLRVLVFYGGDEDTDLEDDAEELLAEWGTECWGFMPHDGADSAGLRPGPYVAINGQVWQPWRVYEDTNRTMTVTTRPGEGGEGDELAVLDISSLAANSAKIVVPPRAYFEVSAEKPLAGIRIAVEDKFDLKGFPTTLCSRAWAESRGSTKESTAPCIRRLQELGAVIVGKTRMSSMNVREEPMECVDYLAPTNARGDGFQTPGSTSSGSCAAVAAYGWLDFAIGSDASGGGRTPACWNGCFAIRPTHGVLETEGTDIFQSHYDVPTVVGLDISRFRSFTAFWYGDSDKLVDESMTVTRILYPDDYMPAEDTDQMILIERFVRELEASLGVQRTAINLARAWRSSRLKDSPNETLAEHLQSAATLPYNKDSMSIIRTFADEYKACYGRPPYMNRALRWRMEMASYLSDSERDTGWERIAAHKEWLLDNLLTEGTLVVLPMEHGRPQYRDESPPFRPFSLPAGTSPLLISPMAGCPEITVPVGEIFYESGISRRLESLPVAVAILSPPGTDLDLIDIVHNVFVEAGRPVKLSTGRSISG